MILLILDFERNLTFLNTYRRTPYLVPGTTCVFFSMVEPDTNCSQKKLGKFSDLKKRGFSTVLNTQRIFL
jgi:hypothetical protein